MDDFDDPQIAQRRQADMNYGYAQLGLNGIDAVTDLYGPQAGDTALCEIVERVETLLRAGDMVTRIGCDKFGIVLGELWSRKQAEKIGQLLLTAFEKPLVFEGHELSIRGNIGIAMGYEFDGVFEEVVSAANNAMISVKSDDELCLAVYSTAEIALSSHLRERNELIHASERGEFVAYYQPKVVLATGEFYGFEALARWQHPTRGLIFPRGFLDAVDEHGLQENFTQSMVSQVLQKICQWKQSGIAPASVAINLAESTLATQKGLEDLENLLETYPDARSHLILEITEDVFIARFADRIRKSILRLSELGLRISMDDFGTGYGSFCHLKELPFDEMKIDMQFVTGIGRGHRSEVIIEGFLSIAHGLNAVVVAEGIETEDQAAFLRERDCDFGQGFLFGRPMSVDQAELYLQSLATRKQSSGQTSPDPNIE